MAEPTTCNACPRDGCPNRNSQPIGWRSRAYIRLRIHGPVAAGIASAIYYGLRVAEEIAKIAGNGGFGGLI